MKEYEPYLSLDQCLSLNREKQKIIDKLKELKSTAYYPRKQTISDIPKGGSENINHIDAYVIKQEILEHDILLINRQISQRWHIVLKQINGIASKEETDMLYMRFYKGLQWKRCAVEMQGKYGSQWNINKIFSTYRQLLAKCTK